MKRGVKFFFVLGCSLLLLAACGEQKQSQDGENDVLETIEPETEVDAVVIP